MGVQAHKGSPRSDRRIAGLDRVLRPSPDRMRGVNRAPLGNDVVLSKVTERTMGATMASTAREIMTGGVGCVQEDESILDAAKKMQELGVGALPICGGDDRLKGMITDRDIVVKVLAQGKDPGSTTAGELAEGKPVTIGADDSIEELVRTMALQEVKRLPVIDGHTLVGVVSEADLAEHATPEQVVAVVRGVYAD